MSNVYVRDYYFLHYLVNLRRFSFFLFTDIFSSSMGHSFEEKTFGHLTYCDNCKQLLWGVVKQGLQCKGKVIKYTKRNVIQTCLD